MTTSTSSSSSSGKKNHQQLLLMTMAVDDNERVVSMIATMNKSLDQKFSIIVKSIGAVTSGLKQVEKEPNKICSRVKGKFADINNNIFMVLVIIMNAHFAVIAPLITTIHHIMVLMTVLMEQMFLSLTKSLLLVRIIKKGSETYCSIFLTIRSTQQRWLIL